MIIEYKYLTWDSNFFGYPIGQANIKEFCEKDYDELKRVLNDRKITLIYLYPLDKVSSKSLKGTNFPLIDTKMTFEKKLNYLGHYKNNEGVESYKDFEEYGNLKRLAFISGEFSRFRKDRNFKNNEFEKLYEEWLKKSINKEIADDVLVFKTNDKINGFVTYKIDNKNITIGLMAVDSEMQGKGVGKKLMKSIENIACQELVDTITVSTQEQNSIAVAFYYSCGFMLREKKEIYHLWLQ